MFMSTQQLQKIQEELLETLTLEEVLEFIQELSQKTLEKRNKQKSNSIPTREATPEEAKAIQEGLDSGFLSVEETNSVLKSLGFK